MDISDMKYKKLTLEQKLKLLYCAEKMSIVKSCYKYRGLLMLSKIEEVSINIRGEVGQREKLVTSVSY